MGALSGTKPVDPSAADPAHLSEVIAHATAPAFLLGAVSGFVAVLMGRMNGILDRIRSVNAIADEDDRRLHLKADLPRLQRRAKLINDAIYLAVGSAISTTLLVILAFVSAFFGFRHEPGAGSLFIVALGLMCASLVTLAREVRIASPSSTTTAEGPAVSRPRGARRRTMKRRDALPAGAAAGMAGTGWTLGFATMNPHGVGLTPASKTRLT